MANVKSDDLKREVLNQLVQHPAIKRAARNVKISPTTLFKWIKESIAEPEKCTLQWLGHEAPFYQHVNAARKLNVIAIDHSARDLALNGHSSPRFYDGKPVWKTDPKIASDALTMDEDEWTLLYGNRPRSDTYARDPETNGLIQEVDVSPPNPAILVKLLTSLAPQVYGEKSEVTHTHQGAVWIEGGAQATPPLLPPPTDFNQDFGLTARPEQVQRPTNTLAIPRQCANSDEFDKRFRKKLLREVVLFYDADNNLLPPLPDDCVVAGTRQARCFEDAGIKVDVAHPTELLDEGFENDWLRELAPNHKRKPPKIIAVAEPVADTAVALDTVLTPEPVEKPGKASARYDAENLGHGTSMPGGRKVTL